MKITFCDNYDYRIHIAKGITSLKKNVLMKKINNKSALPIFDYQGGLKLKVTRPGKMEVMYLVKESYPTTWFQRFFKKLSLIYSVVINKTVTVYYIDKHNVLYRKSLKRNPALEEEAINLLHKEEQQEKIYRQHLLNPNFSKPKLN